MGYYPDQTAIIYVQTVKQKKIKLSEVAEISSTFRTQGDAVVLHCSTLHCNVTAEALES